MASSKEKHDFLPPPYEEHISSKPLDLEARLAQIQQGRIRRLINQHINTLIDKQLSSGLNRAAFAFIPSDISLLSRKSSSDGDDDDGDSLMDFPLGEYHSVVRLEGDNSSEFWHQTSVLEKLQHDLREQLGIEQDSAREKSKPVSNLGSPLPPSRPSGLGFFRKKSPMTHTRADGPAMFSQAGAGWRTEEETAGSGKSLKVKYEEVMIRVQSDLGLYQTRKCPAVVVRLKLG